MRPRVKRFSGYWWIVDHPPAIGPYETKAEVKEAMDGLRSFYQLPENRGFLSLPRSVFRFQGDLEMKVNKTELVSLLVELGIETAGKWPLARLQKRVDKLLELNDGEEPLKAETKEGKKLLSALLAAAENKEEIEVVDDGGAEEENGAEDKPAKKGGKKGAKAEDGDKPAKKKAPRSAGGDGKPGVIASIEEFVKKASKTKPITKEQVLEKLCERFPDRDKEAMAKTVNIQLPSRLNKEKELGIEKSDKGGYYIPS